MLLSLKDKKRHSHSNFQIADHTHARELMNILERSLNDIYSYKRNIHSFLKMHSKLSKF